MAVLEAGLISVLVLWALGSVCYTFRVPGVHRFLNRNNWFAIFTSWAVATTRSADDRPGAYSLDYRDVDAAGNATKWIRAASSDDWAWHAFLWFPGKIAGYGLQTIGRQLVLFSEAHPAPVRLARLGGILERFLRRHHPPRAGVVRSVRMVRRIVEQGREVENVVWQSNAVSDAPAD